MKEKKKILYVDDDEHTLNIVSKFLISQGYRVFTSSNPFVAPLLEKEQPDLIVLDINMPLLSGDRIADILTHQGYAETIPIIFFSSEAPKKIERIVSRYPGSAFVLKQSGLDTLVSRIRQSLHR
jgi:two-component system alkaline phosphatase synthesis response regulator PhoP